MAVMTQTHAALAEDVGNIMSLEHVNVTQPDPLKATVFYIVGLGFTRDPYMTVGINNMWVNVGNSQFHLPTREPQALRGHTGLVVRDLSALKERLASVEQQLEGTKFSWSDKGDYVEAICPWGNVYHLYGPGRFGSMTLGMPYIEFTVPRGTADGITRFYQQVFEAPARVEDGAAVVDIGSGQQLIFRETDAPLPEYDGHHIAVYVTNFSGPMRWLEDRGLVSEGIRNHQFRFQEIVDPEDGKPLFTIEHEVRSARHPFFHRTLVNREPEAPPMVIVSRTGVSQQQ
ncbi:MAG TPA: hypothetical protein VK009_06230 [Chloroflexota bacterium]|nr:hypothetical protein [Chloroflexota bacterium]